MTPRIWLLGFLIVAAAGCQSPPEPKPAPASSSPEGPQANTPAPLDLGGPCVEPPTNRTSLTTIREEELRKAKNFSAMIEGARNTVRNSCANAYQWARLFKIFVEARRYTEAVQTLNEMDRRGFALPFAALSKVAPEFLGSKEFQSTTIGVQYEARKIEMDKVMRGAEAKLQAMAKGDLPPAVYERKGACPFECCTYRQWKTNKAVQLVEAIGSTRVVAQIPAGSDVVGVTGEVHVEPRPHVALEDLGHLKAGDIIFLLDNEGEGYVNYWYEGKLRPDLGFDQGLAIYSYDSCLTFKGQGACSLRQLYPDRTYRNDWWVRIRTSNGREGWVLNTGQFDNIDGCG